MPRVRCTFVVQVVLMHGPMTYTHMYTYVYMCVYMRTMRLNKCDKVHARCAHVWTIHRNVISPGIAGTYPMETVVDGLKEIWG